MMFSTALLLLTSAPVSSPPEGVFKAFAEVCLTNVGDTQQQISVAEKKYNAKVVPRNTVKGVALQSDVFAFHVIADGTATCATISPIDNTVGLEGMTAAIGNALGGAAPNEVNAPDMAYWLITTEGIEGVFSILLLVSSETGQNRASLMISRVKGPIK